MLVRLSSDNFAHVGKRSRAAAGQVELGAGRTGRDAADLVVGQRGSLDRRTGVQGGVDGNTVDMDVERNQFTDNALRYEASITLINSQIKNMLTAIQG